MNKKLIVAILVVLVGWLLIQCDSSMNGNDGDGDGDGDGTPLQAEPLSPPSWIVGNWSDQFAYNSYSFTSDNVVFTSMGVSSFSFKQINAQYATDGKAGWGYFDSTPSSTSYTIEMKQNFATAQTLRFVKTSATTLDYSVDSSATIQLVKL
ncbi:MAG: hypothetical protein NT005_01725 [Spirochaetes bacterium]|nr:hypothetical protein [Spirochaetota bacterium]